MKPQTYKISEADTPDKKAIVEFYSALNSKNTEIFNTLVTEDYDGLIVNTDIEYALLLEISENSDTNEVKYFIQNNPQYTDTESLMRCYTVREKIKFENRKSQINQKFIFLINDNEDQIWRIVSLGK